MGMVSKFPTRGIPVASPINITPTTPSIPTTSQFWCPDNIECTCSGSTFLDPNTSPDHCISASHHLNLHIHINPCTPSSSPTIYFQWLGNTKHMHSVFASQSQKHPPLLDLCIPASCHLNLYIDINPCIVLPLYLPPCNLDSQAISSTYTCYLPLRVKNVHPCLFSPIWPLSACQVILNIPMLSLQFQGQFPHLFVVCYPQPTPFYILFIAPYTYLY